MKPFIISAAILVVMTTHLSAQTSATRVIQRNGFVKLMPVYQRWSVEGDPTFSEASVAISLYQPLSRNASISFRGAGASTSGDVSNLSGPADAQLGANYMLESAHLVFSLGLNFPTGHKELSPDEFQTSLLLSRTALDLRLPNFGTGFNANPGVIWAYTVSQTFVVGLGAAYQYKGSFRPLEGLGDYDPGDESVLTGGFDIQLTQTATLSLDAIFTIFGKDKLDGVEVFASGNKLVTNLQYRQHFDFNQFWLLLRYRSKSKNEFAIGNAFVPEPEKIEPNNFDVQGAYTVRVNDRFSFGIIGEGTFYQKTPAAFSGITLLGAGIAPEISVSPNVSIPLMIKYQSGTLKDDVKLSGLEVGIGVDVKF